MFDLSLFRKKSRLQNPNVNPTFKKIKSFGDLQKPPPVT